MNNVFSFLREPTFRLYTLCAEQKKSCRTSGIQRTCTIRPGLREQELGIEGNISPTLGIVVGDQIVASL